MADSITLAKDAVTTGAAAWALNSDAGKKLIGPLADNLGLAFGQLGDIYGYYQKEVLGKLFTKWAEDRNQKPLTEDEIKRVLPLLRLASEQTNEDLHPRWASLLENVATGMDGVLPSFGQTLSQLTPEEARYLDRIWKCVEAPSDRNYGKRQGRDEFSYSVLIEIYKPNLRAPSAAMMRVHKDRMSPEQLAAFDEMTNFELMIHDLERLSLLEKLMQYVSGDPTRYDIGGERVSIPSERSGIKTSYALTQYGVNFIRAVRPKTY
jgi:hypothetical protein